MSPQEVDGDIRLLPPVPATPLLRPEEDLQPGLTKKAPPSSPPAVLPSLSKMPASTSFAGITFASGGAGWPPDTNGDVGPNHYVETVNTSFAIYSKAGVQQAAMTFNALWSGAGSGTPCDNLNRGDPTVVYDPIADRWFVADFAFNLITGPYYECVAVSKTSNPVTGGWWLYAIRGDDAAKPWFPDYPKMGIWPDGLFMSANLFCETTLSSCPGSVRFQNVRLYAFNRTAMEAGTTFTPQIVDLASSVNFSPFTVIPGNLRGALPPAGRREFFIGQDNGFYQWDVYSWHVDFGTPANSVFSGPTAVGETTAWDPPPNTVSTPGNPLDSLGYRSMTQAQYRNIGGAESLWLNHSGTVGNGSTIVGIVWTQVNVTGGTINTTPVQEQVYGNIGNDGIHRWMGSLAVDKNGNMALGYSAANASNNPSIRYNGRLASNPLNTLPQGEATMIGGLGTQTGNCPATGSTCTRWGDYSLMTVDPNGCTFWYTQEYYDTNTTNWLTRIGSFVFPTCNAPTAVDVARCTAARTNAGVSVSWRTGSEVQTLGFDVWRQTTGSWRKLNAKVLPARHPGGTTGAVYRFLDRAARRGTSYNYRLQVVRLDGTRAWAGYGTSVAAGGRPRS